MIEGHGDDAYRFDGITSDFSSNICANVDHAILMDHLASRPRLLCHYPEPEPWSLEKLIAEYHGIDPQQVIVTNGATDAIYLIAQAFRLRPDIPSILKNSYPHSCEALSNIEVRCSSAPGAVGSSVYFPFHERTGLPLLS